MKTTWLWLALIFALQSQAQNITGCEYFFDTDPGLGNATALTITPGDSLLLSTSIPTNLLSNGFHKLFVRVSDSDGAWSLYEGRSIYIQGSGNTNSTQLSAAEYFYDTDPGFDNGIPIAVTTGDSLSFNTTISTDELSTGFHKLFIRAKNLDGLWSLYEGRTIYIQNPVNPVLPQLSEAEYFYDSDPGLGNGTDFIVTPGDSLMISASVPTTTLSEGFHKLFVRAKNTNNLWSLYEGRTIYIQNPNDPSLHQLTEAEYFYDLDPGLGNATAFSVTPDDSLMINTTTETSLLSEGFHKLFVRAKNDEEKWSLYEGRTFFIEGNLPPDTLTIVAVEYFFDTDLGEGNGTPLTIIPGDSIDANFIVPQSLSIGMHTMLLRCQASNGVWSLTEAREFEDIDVGVDGIDGSQTMLFQNYPNPFVSITKIDYYLHIGSEVTLSISDLSGHLIQQIKQKYVNNGKHTIEIDVTDLTEGYYLYKMETPHFTETKRMIVLK